jgi:hypothetical protein
MCSDPFYDLVGRRRRGQPIRGLIDPAGEAVRGLAPREQVDPVDCDGRRAGEPADFRIPSIGDSPDANLDIWITGLGECGPEASKRQVGARASGYD